MYYLYLVSLNPLSLIREMLIKPDEIPYFILDPEAYRENIHPVMKNYIDDLKFQGLKIIKEQWFLDKFFPDYLTVNCQGVNRNGLNGVPDYLLISKDKSKGNFYQGDTLPYSPGEDLNYKERIEKIEKIVQEPFMWVEVKHGDDGIRASQIAWFLSHPKDTKYILWIRKEPLFPSGEVSKINPRASINEDLKKKIALISERASKNKVLEDQKIPIPEKFKEEVS